MTLTDTRLAAAAGDAGDGTDAVVLPPPMLTVSWSTMTLYPEPAPSYPGEMYVLLELNVTPDPTTNGIPVTGLTGYQSTPWSVKLPSGDICSLTPIGLIPAADPANPTQYTQRCRVLNNPKEFDPTQTVVGTPVGNGAFYLMPVNPGGTKATVTTS